MRQARARAVPSRTVHAPVADTRRFKPELTPSWLHLSALLAGHEPPSRSRLTPGPPADLRMAYIGGGRGFTAAVAAAVHPDSDVWWWDPSLSGTESARAIVNAASLTNVTVHQRADIDPELGGDPRDLVVVDGVLGSLDEARRATVLDAAIAAVRPGGLLCLAYRTEVGWSEVAPVSQLLQHLVARDPRPVEQSVPAALAAVDRLRIGGAQYIVERPVVHQWWQEMRALPITDVIEELANGPSSATSHAQVASSLASSGFTFVGPARADDLGPSLLTRGLAEVVDQQPSPMVREALTDLALRRTHRCDVFRLGYRPLAQQERQRTLDSSTVTGAGLLDPADQTLRRVVPASTRRALAAGALPVAELAESPADRITVLRTLLARQVIRPVVPLDDRAVTAARHLTAVTNRAPVPTGHRIRVAPAMGSALAGSARLTSEQRLGLGVR